MEFGILGPLEVRDNGRLITLPRRKHRALLAILVLRANTVVPADVLLDELWGIESPRTARQALQNYISALRKALGNEILQTQDHGYVLAASPDAIDALRFERLLLGAQDERQGEARAAKLREALSLWRGQPLADLTYEQFAQPEIRRLEELELNAREELVDAELSLGRHESLVVELEPLITAHPYRERLRGQLMLALYRSGRQVEALEAYRTARAALIELGLEPSEGLRMLEQSILRQDPALEPADGKAAIRERRRTVTILACEVVIPPSGLDPEHVRARAARTTAELRAAVELHEGTVEMLAGDELLAVFGAPKTHEDDALRAVRAAADAVATIENAAIRIGIATGEVIAGRGFVTGEVVSVGKQLERGADSGEILVSRATVEACGTAIAVEPVGRAFRLTSVQPATDTGGSEREHALVGRDRELARLRRAYREMCSSRRARLVRIAGEPGIGKTRLARELAREIRDEATVLVGRCVSYGEGATFLPLREMLLQAGLSLDAVIGSAQTVGEQLLEVRRSFESMVDERPLVLVFDDAHWAEPALHDFIEQLGTRSEGRVLTLCLLRADDDAHADTIELGPLPDEQVAELADVLGANEEQRDLVTRSAGGNPLFAEQLIAYAGQGGRPESLPPSISMLIAARLDLLEPGERAVLQRAAVIGSSFSRAAVQDLAPPGESGSVAATLATLTEKHYLRRLRRQAGFRFHHVLVRDTAYASLPREERAALHERFADWLDERGEPDELVGYHLEQAAHQLSELKHDDRRARRLAADAGRRLGAAGIAAWKRGDAAATTALLRRATASLPDEDRRISLLCELGPALRARGELVHAQAVLEQALAGALGAGDRRLELRARLELEAVRLFNDPANASNGLLDTAEAAIPVFEALEDHRSLGRAWLAVAIVRGPIRNAYAACTVAANYALVHYERAGWPTATCLSVLSSALYNGPMPVEPAVDRAEQLIAHADLLGRAHVLARLGGLEAMRGGFAEARTMISWARETFEDLGQASVAQTECGAIDAHVELLAGDEAAAEEALRASCSAFERSGDSAYLATRAADLADLLERHGNVADAAHWCAVAETRGAQDDIPTQALCRATRARLLARAGRIPAAESCAREAVRLTASTDNLNQRARVLVSLADVLRKAGRPQNAAESLAAAVALYAEKGNLVAAEQARHRLGEVASK